MDLKKFWEKEGNGSKWSASPLSMKVMGDLLGWIQENALDEVTILDIGSGTGRLFKNLSNMGVNADVTMVDWSEVGRKKCKEETGHEPDAWDGTTLPYEDDSFDLVVMMDLLIHIAPSQFNQVVDEAKRVSKNLLYYNITTWEGPSIYAPDAWCFTHNHHKQIVDRPVVKEWAYQTKDQSKRLTAYVVEVQEREDDLQSQFGEDAGDTGEVDSSSSDESSVSDDTEVGPDVSEVGEQSETPGSSEEGKSEK